jgi:hypothetical protein
MQSARKPMNNESSPALTSRPFEDRATVTIKALEIKNQSQLRSHGCRAGIFMMTGSFKVLSTTSPGPQWWGSWRYSYEILCRCGGSFFELGTVVFIDLQYFHNTHK